VIRAGDKDLRLRISKYHQSVCLVFRFHYVSTVCIRPQR